MTISSQWVVRKVGIYCFYAELFSYLCFIPQSSISFCHKDYQLSVSLVLVWECHWTDHHANLWCTCSISEKNIVFKPLRFRNCLGAPHILPWHLQFLSVLTAFYYRHLHISAWRFFWYDRSTQGRPEYQSVDSPGELIYWKMRVEWKIPMSCHSFHTSVKWILYNHPKFSAIFELQLPTGVTCSLIYLDCLHSLPCITSQFLLLGIFPI